MSEVSVTSEALCIRFAQPDGPQFEDAFGSFESALSGTSDTSGFFSTTSQSFVNEDNE
jgi:hypothetical protein